MENMKHLKRNNRINRNKSLCLEPGGLIGIVVHLSEVISDIQKEYTSKPKTLLYSIAIFMNTIYNSSDFQILTMPFFNEKYNISSISMSIKPP